MNGGGIEGLGDDAAALRGAEVYMWGYLPGALPQRSPLLTPVIVRVPPSNGSWNDVCSGGCGFAMAISGGALSLQFVLLFLLFLDCELKKKKTTLLLSSSFVVMSLSAVSHFCFRGFKAF